jgi:hypothetical protein
VYICGVPRITAATTGNGTISLVKTEAIANLEQDSVLVVIKVSVIEQRSTT